MSECNPYQTPSSDVGIEPPLTGGALWYVGDVRLYFRDGAMLPAVDLKSGRKDRELDRVYSSFIPKESRLGAILFDWLPTMVCLVTSSVLGLGWITTAVLLLASLALKSAMQMILGSTKPRKEMLFWYRVREEEVRYQQKLRMMSAWFYLFIACAILGGILKNSSLLIGGVVLLGLLAFSSRFLLKRSVEIRQIAYRDGWHEVEGIPREALAVLAAIQAEAVERHPGGMGSAKLPDDSRESLADHGSDIRGLARIGKT